MPVFRSGVDQAPTWCELRYFDIVELPKGGSHAYERVGKKEKLIVGEGECVIAFDGKTVRATTGTNLDLVNPTGRFEVREALTDTILVRMCGEWGDETGGSGLFRGENSDDPHDGGDPVEYPKKTNFDSHYHDCDEYWILFEGRARAVSEGKTYELGPGDCLATGMGHHHDMSEIYEPVKAVYFETTLEGAKRRGHLWNHTHGPAEPKADRV